MRSPTRRSVLRYGLAGCLLGLGWRPSGAAASSGVTDSEIVLGTSAAFSGPSRGLGIELFRGASAYFEHVNRNGGVRGRRIVLRTYDDGYQPDPSVQNTMTLMLEDEVFALFGYVGTPTVTRVLPMLKKFQERQVYLFFPFTGAQPQREPPYGPFAFNLRASYRQETAGLVQNFVGIGRKRIAVFYQADAYGRSAPCLETVRRADRRRGDLQAGLQIHGHHARSGGDTEGIAPRCGHLHRGLRRLCRVSPRRGGPWVARADRQRVLRRQREPSQSHHARALTMASAIPNCWSTRRSFPVITMWGFLLSSSTRN